MNKTNIVLIGMPSTGKSTLGIPLAKQLGKTFVDADQLIIDAAGMPTQQIIDNLGVEKFMQFEADVLLNITNENAVIATGGSAIYSKEAMLHLKKSSLMVHLSAQKDTLKNRIHNFETRAIVNKKQLSFEELYAERMPLYQAIADIDVTTDSQNTTIEKTLDAVIKAIHNYNS